MVSASTNTLTVNVPSGATYQPITINANGLTAYTDRPFTVTFNSPGFSSNSFKAKVDISARNASTIAVKDMDNDGRPDIISNGTVYKNNSVPGAANFQPVNQFLPYGYYASVAVDDFNGDGKQDLVTTNFGDHTISLLINNGVNDQISFTGPINYGAGFEPYGVAIGDLNDDGKPDIAVTNQRSQNVAVFINNTLPGGAVQFQTAAFFPVQNSPRGLTIGDVDGDGKPDVVAVNQGGSVSILRNTSFAGSFSFAPAVNIAMPAGSSPESAAIVDLDNDSKPDIAVSNNNAGNISVLKNTSSIGALSFLPRLDIPTGQDDFTLSAGDINGDGKPDLAVANQQGNSATVLINTSAGNVISFNRTDFPVGSSSRATALADVDGDGKPDLIVGNNESNDISILLSNSAKIQAVITFAPPLQIKIDADNILRPVVSSNNNESPITFTSSNPAVAYVGTDGLIHVIAPGTTIITAHQAESASYLAAAPVSRNYDIKQYQGISFPALNSRLTCDNDFPIDATSQTPQPLFYSSSNPAVATVSATGVIQITGPGSTTITVSQPGNELFIDAAPQSQQLIVNLPSPPVVVVTASNNSVCEGSPVTFTANATNAGANPIYQWTVNGINNGTNNAQFTLNYVNAADIIQCKVTTTNGCLLSGVSNTISIGVQANLTPSVSLQLSGGISICANFPLTVQATPVNGGIDPLYQWRVNGTIVSSGSQASYTYLNLSNGDRLTCVMTNNSSQCLAAKTALSNEVGVNIIPPDVPDIVLTASHNDIYAGTQVTFNATCQLPVISYQWQINNKVAGNNTATFTSANLKNGDVVTCTITAAGACVVPKTSPPITMNVLPPLSIKIPNTFSPNGDGVNDVWDIPELSFYPGSVVKIFNRNGFLIYHMKAYYTPWDGTFEGKKLPFGTYFYIIELSGLDHSKLTGYIALLR